MVQGMMVALVCGAAFLTGCSSKDGEKTVFLDDYEKKRSSDNLLLIQIIKENINIWSNETEEENK